MSGASGISASSAEQRSTAKKHDFTEGSLDRGLLLLAPPMILEMLIDAIFMLIDLKWMGMLGTDAMAVGGNLMAMVALLNAPTNGLQLAVIATVSRRVGEHRL